MRITFAVIGKLKPSPEMELIQRYSRQLPWHLSFRELDAKKGLSGEKLKCAEAELLLGATQHCHRRIALDERGKVLGSAQLAHTIGQWQTEGCSHFGLMIGGQDGLDISVRQQSNLVLSFGALTWPHMLARAMATEQLYRASAILAGHPYHRV